LPSMNDAIGIDLGGSSIKVVVVNGDGDVLRRQLVPFEDDARMDWAAKISSIADGLKRTHKEARIGISAPGLAARDARSIAVMPVRLQGLAGLDWTKHLKSATPVPVLNDAQAALLGEVWLGAGKSMSNVIMLTLGTGVGGAAMVDGRLLHGHIGRAGHLGHISLDPNGAPDVTGTPGSLEIAMGNYTIQERSGGRFRTTHDLVAAHLKGDADATEIWLKSVQALAAAVASFINILDPEGVIIGGGIAQSGDALFRPLQKYLDVMEWRPAGQRAKIVAAELGEFAGAIGAARNALSFVP
ncbi:MAG TPA: ROK family protein, partial [Verrucomicrobiae bacterium]|nr:ROK family protein [Verrucomicrobiae bacterium]